MACHPGNHSRSEWILPLMMSSPSIGPSIRLGSDFLGLSSLIWCVRENLKKKWICSLQTVANMPLLFTEWTYQSTKRSHKDFLTLKTKRQHLCKILKWRPNSSRGPKFLRKNPENHLKNHPEKPQASRHRSNQYQWLFLRMLTSR